MTLKPKTSYSIISSSDFITTLITNYLIHLNSIHGVNLGQNIFGNILLVSNVDEPSKNKIVISNVPRSESFHIVNVDEHWEKVYIEIEGVKNPEVIKLLKTITGSLDEKYYMFKRILFLVDQDSFDVATASDIINSEYKLRFSVKDKMNSIIAMVNDFSYSSWMSFVQHVNEEDYGLLISTLEKANNGEIKQIQDNSNTTKNLLNISISALKSETFYDFQLNIMKSVLK